MSCPIVITNVLTPAADYTIDDLAFLTIEASGSVDVKHLFSLEEIANSIGLQDAILDGSVTVTYAGELITDLADLCITPSDLTPKTSFVWSAGRKNAIGAAAIDLASLDGASSGNMPFVSVAPCEIKTVVVRSNTDQDWTMLILRRTGDTLPWTQVKSETIDTQTKVIDYSLAPIVVSPGDQIRIRYERIGHTIFDPQVNLLVTEV